MTRIGKDKKVPCFVSRFGLPTMAESGGSKHNSGYAYIIGNKDGSKKSPIFIPKYGNLVNTIHAYFVVKENDIHVEVSHFEKRFEIFIYCVKSIDIFSKEVTLTLIEVYKDENYDDFFNSLYFKAVLVAVKKASTLFCREAMYYYSAEKKLQKKLVTN